MKKLFLNLVLIFVLALCLTSCGNNEKTIKVGATPSPHAEILNCKAVKDYIESKGYKLDVKVFQDWGTLNKSLHTESIDANYFQHTVYLEGDCETYGFDLASACEVHNEPLNLYGKVEKQDWSNTKIYIANDKSNAERALKLLVANGLLDSYSVEEFNANNPVYTSSIGVTIKCLDPGLLHRNVTEDGYAVIPGNYALTAWGTETATKYKIFGEAVDVAYPNIIAVRTEDLNIEKIKVLVEALGQPEVQAFIEETYGPTVNYVYKSLLK